MTSEGGYLVFLPGHIGDFIVPGGLIHALKLPKRMKKVKIVCAEYLQKLKIHFAGVDDTIYIPQQWSDAIRFYTYVSRAYRTEKYFWFHWKETISYQINGAISYGLIYSKDYNFIENYKLIADLPFSTEWKKPKIAPISNDEIYRLHQNYLINDRTIILTPHSYSIEQLSDNAIFWVELANQLIQRGYNVYTNVAGDNEQTIPNTQPIRTTFNELFYLSDKINCFIGYRSGLLDFLSLSNAKILCIDGIGDWSADLKSIFPDSNVQTFYSAQESYQLLRKYLDDFQAQRGIALQINLNIKHRYIDSQIFSTSYEILQNILNAVERR